MPSFYYEDTFVHNVQSTLAEMGHEVHTLGFVPRNEYYSFPKYAARMAKEMIVGDRPSRLDYKILAAARKIKPDVVFSTTGSVHPLILEELGKIVPGRRVLWWGDAPANSQRWGIVDPGWDTIYIKDRVAAEKLRLVGRNAHLLHEAMNPNWHKPLAQQRNEAVVIAGSYYAFRQALVLRLMQDNVLVQLYGPAPPRWAHPKIKEQHTGEYIVREQKSRVFGEGMASLNSFHLAEADSLNCRAFEIAGAGGLQLIEHRCAVEDCFEPGKELLVFRTYEELLDHVQRARKYPSEMTGIREAGAKRALAEHTYRHRLKVILENL